jgi:hypothetical protein
MKAKLLVGLFLMMAQMPKNDPSGVWQSESGSKYTMKLTGNDVKVSIVPNSNPKYIQYQVDLTLEKDERGTVVDPNTYKGTGFFVAKMQTGKECKVDTEWRITVVQHQRIFGSATNVVVDSNTCEVKEKTLVQLDLKRVE